MFFPDKIAEVKVEMTKFAEDHPADKEQVRAEAIRRLEEVVDKLPLPKSDIEDENTQLKNSNILQKIVKATKRKEMRERIRRALAEIIADNVA